MLRIYSFREHTIYQLATNDFSTHKGGSDYLLLPVFFLCDMFARLQNIYNITADMVKLWELQRYVNVVFLQTIIADTFSFVRFFIIE